MALAVPGITWKGTRSAATRELAIQIDAAWMRMLPGAQPKEWWMPLISVVPLRPDVEAVKLVVDMEDLGTFKRKVGPRTAKAPPKLTFQLLPRDPWYRDRHIPINDLRFDNFMGWPDRLAAILLAARRTPGMIFTEKLFAATTTTLTIQGVPLIGTGHKCNFNDPDVTTTFDNLVTGNSSSSTPGTMDSFGFEYAQEVMFSRPGPDGVYGLDQEINYVLGGTKMKKKFDRMFKRVIVLEDSDTNDAAAGVTNIHQTQIEGGVVAIVSSWMDRHPFKLANPTLDQWWSFSSTTQARAMGMLIENGGAPTVDVFDEGSEYAREHEHVWIKADMDCNGGAAFPQVITEHRGA
jgi:hypothetical protein